MRSFLWLVRSLTLNKGNPMSRLKVAVLHPVKVLFTEHFSNGGHLIAIVGIAVALVGGTAYLATRWAF